MNKFAFATFSDPAFVRSLEYGDFIYFFFREVSLDDSSQILSRIARVCKVGLSLLQILIKYFLTLTYHYAVEDLNACNTKVIYL